MPNEQDNWEHRGDNMRCKTCMFYIPKGGGCLGRCRESSPTIKGWPAVFPNDWCGAHKLDEEKLNEKTKRVVCVECGFVTDKNGKCVNVNCKLNEACVEIDFPR